MKLARAPQLCATQFDLPLRLNRARRFDGKKRSGSLLTEPGQGSRNAAEGNKAGGVGGAEAEGCTAKGGASSPGRVPSVSPASSRMRCSYRRGHRATHLDLGRRQAGVLVQQEADVLPHSQRVEQCAALQGRAAGGVGLKAGAAQHQGTKAGLHSLPCRPARGRAWRSKNRVQRGASQGTHLEDQAHFQLVAGVVIADQAAPCLPLYQNLALQAAGKHATRQPGRPGVRRQGRGKGGGAWPGAGPHLAWRGSAR